MDLKDEFRIQTGGSLIAIRVVLAALLKSHPEPQRLLQDIQDILAGEGALDGQLPAPIQASFDERIHELTSHLYARLPPRG